jgi:hypothetical protein
MGISVKLPELTIILSSVLLYLLRNESLLNIALIAVSLIMVGLFDVLVLGLNLKTAVGNFKNAVTKFQTRWQIR